MVTIAIISALIADALMIYSIYQSYKVKRGERNTLEHADKIYNINYKVTIMSILTLVLTGVAGQGWIAWTIISLIWGTSTTISYFTIKKLKENEIED